jgi:hypothetical protein
VNEEQAKIAFFIEKYWLMHYYYYCAIVIQKQSSFNFILEDSADLFVVQDINDVKSYLMTSDVFHRIYMKCTSLEDVKKKMSYKQYY